MSTATLTPPPPTKTNNLTAAINKWLQDSDPLITHSNQDFEEMERLAFKAAISYAYACIGLALIWKQIPINGGGKPNESAWKDLLKAKFPKLTPATADICKAIGDHLKLDRGYVHFLDSIGYVLHSSQRKTKSIDDQLKELGVTSVEELKAKFNGKGLIPEISDKFTRTVNPKAPTTTASTPAPTTSGNTTTPTTANTTTSTPVTVTPPPVVPMDPLREALLDYVIENITKAQKVLQDLIDKGPLTDLDLTKRTTLKTACQAMADQIPV